MSAEIPQEIKDAIQRQIELQQLLQGIDMTNVYGVPLDDQVKLGVQKVQAMRELAQVTGQIQEYIDDGKKPPLTRNWR